jgi:uncharacterized protein (TIGR02246 family)
MTHEQAIRSVVESEMAAANAGDLEGWLAHFADDVSFLPANESILLGKEAVRAWGEFLFSQFDLHEDVSVEEVVVSGDLAYTRTTFAMTMTPKAGGESFTDVGKMLSIFGRQQDGSWKWSRACWNSDGPPSEVVG